MRERVSILPTSSYLSKMHDAGWTLIALEWEREVETSSVPEPEQLPAASEEIPFGLRIGSDCRHLEDDPLEMQTLRFLAEMIVQDISFTSMADALNVREYRTRDGVPGAAIAGAIFSDVQGVGHAGEGDVLDDHFGEEAQRLHFERVIFEMTAIGADPQAKWNLFGSGGKLLRLRNRRGFHLALPFEGDQRPAGVVHFRKIAGSREDANSFTHAIDLFHGSLPDGRYPNAEDAICRRKIGQSSCRKREKRKPQNQKDLQQQAKARTA